MRLHSSWRCAGHLSVMAWLRQLSRVFRPTSLQRLNKWPDECSGYWINASGAWRMTFPRCFETLPERAHPASTRLAVNRLTSERELSCSLFTSISTPDERTRPILSARCCKERATRVSEDVVAKSTCRWREFLKYADESLRPFSIILGWCAAKLRISAPFQTRSSHGDMVSALAR